VNQVLHHLTASIEENVGIYNIREDSMDIIKDRDNTHAKSEDFHKLADTAQMLKLVFKASLNDQDKWLDNDMMESLDVICTKIARIVHGNPKHIDHWADIAGYSQLIVNRLQSYLPPPTQKQSKQRK